jgi:small subunit ribosomal protein S3
MGQKVSPHGLRVGVIKDWNSKWYAGKENFADLLAEDDAIRKVIKKSYYGAGISKVVIERPSGDKLKIRILTARPGMLIGSKGEGIDEMTAKVKKLTDKGVNVSVEELKRSELDAQVSAESIADALEHRTSFRRAMKQAIGRTMKAGAKGCKVLCSGRLGGAEIARAEKYSEGNVPLHTLRADIDYGFAEANTTYGKIGVKVWINHGEILDKGLQEPIPEVEEKKGGRKGGKKFGDRKGGRRRNDRDRRSGRPEITKSAYSRRRAMPKPAPAPEEAVEAENAENTAVQEAPEVQAPAKETEGTAETNE